MCVYVYVHTYVVGYLKKHFFSTPHYMRDLDSLTKQMPLVWSVES